MIEPVRFMIQITEGPDYDDFTYLTERMMAFYGSPTSTTLRPPSLAPGSVCIVLIFFAETYVVIAVCT